MSVSLSSLQSLCPSQPASVRLGHSLRVSRSPPSPLQDQTSAIPGPLGKYVSPTPPPPAPQPAGIYINVDVHIIYICTPGAGGADTGAFVSPLPAACLPATPLPSSLPPARLHSPLPHRKVPVGPASFLCLRCEWARHGRGGQGGLGTFPALGKLSGWGRNGTSQPAAVCLSASVVPGRPRVLTWLLPGNLSTHLMSF